MIRMVFARFRRKSGMSVEDFQEHLVRKYGPLMASFGVMLGVRKYVQSVTLDGEPAAAGWIESRGSEMEPSYDAVSEVWWDTLDKLSATLSSSEGKEAWAALLAEEQKFIGTMPTRRSGSLTNTRRSTRCRRISWPAH